MTATITTTISLHGPVDPVDVWGPRHSRRYAVDLDATVTVFGEADVLAGMLADRLLAVCAAAGLEPPEVTLAAAARRAARTEEVPA